MKRAWLLLSLSLVLSLLSCSGGGGGGGGGGGRTTETAFRLIHAGVALAPLEVYIAELMLQKAHYGELTDFVAVEEQGPQTVILSRANTPGSEFRTLSIDFAKETEYSIFVYGGAFLRSDNVRVIVEPVEQPESGFARIQFLNGYESSQPITISGGGLEDSITAPFGGDTGFHLIPVSEEPQEFIARVGGAEFARVTITVEDRGELTFVASGSNELPFGRLKVYTDLD